MHTCNETSAGVPAFLAKLWRLVDDPDTNSLICWSKDGRSFIIQNQAQFARELLPMNYKHNNMASFIRQLNMYGFHKITSIDNGGLKFDRDEMEFSHPCFKRNSPFLLDHIKRKIATTKHIDEKAALKPEAVTKVLQDVKAMRGRQDSLDSRFSVMKQENEALWREIASLRQKHAKQQQIVNKLIQFLITIVQPSRNMSTVKRHMQLMINDIPENERIRNTSESESDCGPVIHELGEELLAESDELMEANSPYNCFAMGHDTESRSPLNIERPESSISQYDYSNHSAEDGLMNGSNTGKVISGSFYGSSSDASTSGRAAASADVGGGGGDRTSSPSVVQSLYPDGSSIVYHVTEMPDAQSQDCRSANGNIAGTTKTSDLFDVLADGSATNSSFSEENVLTTPLVREQMARTQMLKQKNKQRRQRQLAGKTVPAEGRAAKVQRGAAAKRQAATAVSPKKNSGQFLKMAAAGKSPPTVTQPQQQQQPMSPQITKIKEEEIDPMLFLYQDSELQNAVDSIAANTSNSNISNNNNNTNDGANAVQYVPVNNSNGLVQPSGGKQRKDLYDANQYIVNDMPAELFEDGSIMVPDSDFVENFEEQQQQQYGQSTASSALSNADTILPSTSAAAKRSAGNAQAKKSPIQNTNNNNSNNNSNVNNSSDATNNMAVTKYKNNFAQPPNVETRLSTKQLDDVHGHLDNVQDELETLKDLLKGDGYSLDASTLMGTGATASSASSNNPNNNRFYLSQGLGMDGDFFTKLFNDSDLLGPYGLTFNNDLPSTDKKGTGNELMAYQPMYDFNDIINGMDDKTNDADPALLPPLSTPPNRQTPTNNGSSSASSVLNTP